MIRVLLCDDQPIVTEGLQVILRAAADIEVVGACQDGADAVAAVERLRPDVVLMDLRMPIMNGIQATQQIRQGYPETRVLVLTTYDDDEWVLDAIRAGAAGYLLKDTPREQIIAAIRGTAAGTTHIDPKVAGKLFAYVAQPGNTPAAHSTLAVELSARARDSWAPGDGAFEYGNCRAALPLQRHYTKLRQQHLCQARRHRPYTGCDSGVAVWAGRIVICGGGRFSRPAEIRKSDYHIYSAWRFDFVPAALSAAKGGGLCPNK